MSSVVLRWSSSSSCVSGVAIGSESALCSSDRIGHLRRGPVDQHFEALFAQRGLNRAAHSEWARVHRLRRDPRSDDRALRARRRALGARLLDDDRSGLGWPSFHSDRAHRFRHCHWSKARRVANLYPAHVGDYAWRADARRAAPRQEGSDTHRTLSCSSNCPSSADLAVPGRQHQRMVIQSRTPVRTRVLDKACAA